MSHSTPKLLENATTEQWSGKKAAEECQNAPKCEADVFCSAVWRRIPNAEIRESFAESERELSVLSILRVEEV
jgi:hypothetical protein